MRSSILPFLAVVALLDGLVDDAVAAALRIAADIVLTLQRLTQPVRQRVAVLVGPAGLVDEVVAREAGRRHRDQQQGREPRPRGRAQLEHRSRVHGECQPSGA